MNVSVDLRRRWLARSALMTVACALALLLPSQPAGAAVPFTFNVIIHQAGLTGTGPANDSLTVALRNARGDLIDNVDATTDGNGRLSLARPFNRTLEIGDWIVAKDATKWRKFTVPELRGAGNRVTDIVRGVAPPNANLDLQLYRCGLSRCTYAGRTSVKGPRTVSTQRTSSRSRT
jgi:hypothetical protein